MPKGWTRWLVPRCRRAVDAFKEWASGGAPESFPAQFAWDEDGATQASWNHRGQAWSVELFRAAMWGTAEEYARARRVVLHWMAEEKRVGWWGPEQFAGGTHAAQELNGFVVASLALEVAEQPRRGPDPELRAALDGHWRDTWALLDAISTPGGGIVGPGARQPNGPSLEPLAIVQRERRNALWELYAGVDGATGELVQIRPWVRLKHKGALGRKPKPGKPDPWASDFYAFADGFRELVKRGAIPLGASPALPRLRRQMTVYRGKGWHYCEVEPPEGPHADDWTAWAYCDHDAHDRGQRPLTGATWGRVGDGKPRIPTRAGMAVVRSA